MATKKRLLIIFASLFIIIFGSVIGIVIGHSLRSTPPTQNKEAIRLQQAHLEILEENAAAKRAQSYLNVSLPTAPDKPSPNFTPGIFKRGLKSHVVVGYVPSFELGAVTPQDLSAVSIVCYDGIDVGNMGQIINDQSLSLLSQSQVANLVNTSQQDRDMVLLTVFASSNQIIKSITDNPRQSASNLSKGLVPLLKTYGFNGVSVDIEGQYGKERAGFVSFMRYFKKDLLPKDKSAFLLLDTYANSAADPNNFYNIASLYPLVNDIFIMGYDMDDPSISSPNAPLVNENLGNSDIQSLLSYIQVVPASKLILGVPFYGYDFSTKNKFPGSPAIGSDPVAVTWASILATHRKQLWDPLSLTSWYRFKVGRRWHQTWFDNPVSIALKTALADEMHLGGVGTWALGMNGTDTQMLAALQGGAKPLKGAEITLPSPKVKKRGVKKK